MRGQQASTFNGLRQLGCTSICHYMPELFGFDQFSIQSVVLEKQMTAS
jgi:hypothetical protein